MTATIRSKKVKKHLKQRQQEEMEKNDARLKKQAERKMRTLKATARREYEASGGDDFDSAWPKLRDSILADAVKKRVAEVLPPLRL